VKKILVGSIILLLIVGFYGFYILVNGYTKTITKGKFMGFEIDSTKQQTLKNLTGFENLAGVKIEGRMMSFADLETNTELGAYKGENWEHIRTHNIWEFSPNVGHTYTILYFEKEKLQTIKHTQYFIR
jgi:hypothetical protein